MLAKDQILELTPTIEPAITSVPEPELAPCQWQSQSLPPGSSWSLYILPRPVDYRSNSLLRPHSWIYAFSIGPIQLFGCSSPVCDFPLSMLAALRTFPSSPLDLHWCHPATRHHPLRLFFWVFKVKSTHSVFLLLLCQIVQVYRKISSLLWDSSFLRYHIIIQSRHLDA